MICQYCGLPLDEEEVHGLNTLCLDLDEEGEIQSTFKLNLTGTCESCGFRTHEERELDTDYLDYNDYTEDIQGDHWRLHGS